MSRTNGVQGLQGFELLVECSYAAREAVIQVDDLEDLLLRDEPQFATEVNMVRDALVLLRTVADALHAARTGRQSRSAAGTAGLRRQVMHFNHACVCHKCWHVHSEEKKALIVSIPKNSDSFFPELFQNRKERID